MEDSGTDEEAERAAICRAIAEEFALPEDEFADSVYLAADWTGDTQAGAVVLVQTGNTLPASDTEEVAQSWMNVNDRLEEQGVDLYAEVKSSSVTAFYRFS
jgi:hypothetical protein